MFLNKMPFWKTGFSQMQATATALTACTCVKFRIQKRLDHITKWSSVSYLIFSSYAK